MNLIIWIRARREFHFWEQLPKDLKIEVISFLDAATISTLKTISFSMAELCNHQRITLRLNYLESLPNRDIPLFFNEMRHLRKELPPTPASEVTKSVSSNMFSKHDLKREPSCFIQ